MSPNEHKKFWVKPLVFIISLISGTWLILWIEQLKPSDTAFADSLFDRKTVIKKSAPYPLRNASGKLTARDAQYAEIAWSYFKNNYHEKTGMVNGREGIPFFTLKELGSYLMGLVSAYELGVISKKTFDKRIQKAMATLAKMRLNKRTGLPNRYYDPRNMLMIDEKREVTWAGCGWSAMDIARFFAFVNKIRFDYPHYYPAVKKIIDRWNISNFLVDGFFYGGDRKAKWPEGTLGYEEYAAKTLLMSGYDASRAYSYTDFLRFRNILGVPVGVDTRKGNEDFSINYIHSEPYILDGLEYGWDANSRELGWRIYQVQEKRYQKEGVITAISEEYLGEINSPVCNTVYGKGMKWQCFIRGKGEAMEQKFISTSAAFGWYVLFQNDYADLLMQKVSDLYDPKKGWYAGCYESDYTPITSITANTNGLILEALNYKKNGPVIGKGN